MATQGTFEVNATDVYKRFTELSIKEMKKAVTAGVRKGLAVVRNKARKTFRSIFPTGAKKNPKYHDKLIDGIRSTKVKETGKGDIMGYVLITSNRKHGSGSYRLVFLEGGTVKRQTRRGYNRGSIKASYFFTRSVNSTNQEYNKAMVEAIDQTIDKINQANLK